MSRVHPGHLLSTVGRRSSASDAGFEVMPRVRDRAWRGRSVLLEESLFRDVLRRERKRADRFAQPFVLVMVSCRTDRSCDDARWLSVVESLTVVKRDTDLLGWFKRGSTLAMFVPEIEASDEAFIKELESRVEHALALRVGAEVRDDFVVQVHRQAPVLSGAAGSLDSASPLKDLDRSWRSRLRMTLKRGLDIGVSVAALFCAFPLFLLITALVRLTSRGPVFFRQPRVGEGGRTFTMLKFRTMHVNADNAIHKNFVSQLIKGEVPTGGDVSKEAQFKIVDDPRVTRVGRVLRKTSMDELPQLWNVFRGDMSLVGPRPPLAYEVEQYKPWHYRRVLEARPGITGLWQVSGRSRTTFDDMVRLDLRYAKNPSPWTDLRILAATPRAVITGKGAC